MGCYSCDKAVFSGSLAAPQTVQQGAPVGFSKNLAAGVRYTDTSVTLYRPGIYLITVSASAATTSSAATDVVLQMQRNGNQVGKVQARATSGSTTAYVGLVVNAIIKVDKTCCPFDDKSATMTFVNSGAAANYSAVDVTVVQL